MLPDTSLKVPPEIVKSLAFERTMKGSWLQRVKFTEAIDGLMKGTEAPRIIAKTRISGKSDALRLLSVMH